MSHVNFWLNCSGTSYSTKPEFGRIGTPLKADQKIRIEWFNKETLNINKNFANSTYQIEEEGNILNQKNASWMTQGWAILFPNNVTAIILFGIVVMPHPLNTVWLFDSIMLHFIYICQIAVHNNLNEPKTCLKNTAN